MAGPINYGQLVGGYLYRTPDTQNLADLSAICLHYRFDCNRAIKAVQLRHNSSKPFRTNSLTPRELQIAELVALGRTNAEIGNELWITENSVKQALKRMFRKLEVASRAEMVGQLSATRYDMIHRRQT